MISRRRRTHALAAGVVVAALGVPIAAWASGALRNGNSSFSSFQNEFVSFRYPAPWRTTVWKEQAPHFQPMVYLSTQPTHDPCKTSVAARAMTVACGWPVRTLADGGILVKWENKGFPGTSVTRFPGAAARVGGRIAKVSIARPGSCRTIGADETMTVAIARPLTGNWTEVSACLRGPNLATHEAQVRELLSSARFLTP
jgi:hypothetical protein